MKRKLLVIFTALAVCFTGMAYDFTPAGVIPDTEAVACAASIKSPVIKVTSSGYEGLKISWEKVSGSKKYYVYRATSKTGKYSKITSTAKTSYTDKKIDQNRTYYYKVKAIGKNSTSSYSSCKSGKVSTAVKLSTVPAYSGKAAVTINNNVPKFSERMKKAKSYESYSKLDSLGRCGVAIACVGRDLMPTEERGSIGMIKPAGWHTVRYDDLVEGRYAYNRCHLIGYQLSGENANERNLITGTRYLNVDGMLPYENEVADYVKSTGNHVLYRVTPIYSGDELLARGVQMEAYSVEDSGKGVCFNVFAYNVQPGIVIDYATGDSRRAEGSTTDPAEGTTPVEATYVLNKNTKKFHLPTCSSASDIKPQNKEVCSESRDSIIKRGYEPCKRCNP